MEGRLNINMIKGGIKVNIVPDECIISVDRRLIPEENIEDARKELLDTLASVPGVTWQLEGVHGIPTVPPADDPAVDRLASIMGDTIGQANKFGEMGSGDLSHIVAGWGCKAFGLGVIRPECNIHGKEEFVYLKDIDDVAKILARFLSSQA
jgi:acetylornithine deacetylase/succinyl-diaminopimelate desuccinylase-like protein